MSECKEGSETFWEIAVASPSAKRTAVFTYASDVVLGVGDVVEVPLRRAKVPGIVLRDVKKPPYASKKVLETYGVRLNLVALETLEWMLNFYPLEQGAVARLYTPPAKPKKKTASPQIPATSILRDITNDDFTSDQMEAFRSISAHHGPIILHGETGSGKTRVYQKLAQQTLESGKSVLVLTPEISLSQHLFRSFQDYFKDIVVFHSLLTQAQRRDIWYGLSNSDLPRIIIGPRSALFLPLKSVGMIIMDEAHDTSYKHQQSPHFSTLQVATTLAKRYKAPLVYGSATPNVSDYYAAVKKNLPILRMTERPVASRTGAEVKFKVISTRDTSQFTQSPIIASSVIEAIRQSAKRGKQSLLLLNRRGTAQLLRCEDCGYDLVCQNCSHALVYHKDMHKAVCHICDKKYELPPNCPECGGTIRMLIMGTKYIEDHLEKLFPDAPIMRIDSDSVERDKLDDTLAQLQNGEALIIVGTQLLAKGIDLPLLENVVIIDAARQSSDYLSDERYYQLLHQVIGRGSRGHQQTSIFVQTSVTDDQIITWATNEQWFEFYSHELADRKLYRYPPFTYLASAYFEKSSSKLAESAVTKLQASCTSNNLHVEILGPLRDQRFFGKKPVWRVLLRSTSRNNLVAASHLAPSDWHIDFEPVNV